MPSSSSNFILESCPKTIFQVCIFIVFRIATFHVVGTPVYFTGNHASEIEKPVEPTRLGRFDGINPEETYLIDIERSKSLSLYPGRAMSISNKPL